jgi:hypothetical protein
VCFVRSIVKIVLPRIPILADGTEDTNPGTMSSRCSG